MLRFLFFVMTMCSIVSSSAQSKLMFLFSDSTTDKHHGFLGYPAFSYAPETRLSVGLSLIYYFRTNKRDSSYRPSIMHPVAAYTEDKQFYLENPFQLFFDKEKYYIYGIAAYYNYPYNFYGIGNGVPRSYVEKYNSIYGNYDISFLRKINRHWYGGIKLKGGYYSITQTIPGDLLASGTITGSKGGNSIGIGPMFLFDSRDNIFASTKGSFVEISSAFNSKHLLSNYSFASFILDARKFISIKKNVFAFQTYMSAVTGNAPFYQLSLLGGPKRMRGYYEGRYRDNDYIMAQCEYRSPFVMNRFGLVIFAGAGTVFHNINSFNPTYIQPSYGGGLRLKFNRKESLHVRLDAAFGNNTMGYYLYLSEAF